MMYKMHEVIWNSENVKNFWDGQSLLKPHDENFFAYQVGRRLVQFVSNGNKVLDYACGQGFLIEQILIERQAEVYGFDLSEESINLVKKKFENRDGFVEAKCANGFPIPFDDNMFDIVFLLETVEHLDDTILEQVVREIYRVLKPGGRVIVTTPNKENLASGLAVCPECGCIYHNVQHMRTWDGNSIGQYFKGHNFKTVKIKETRLHTRYPIWIMDLGTLITGKKRLNLIYIGQK